MSEGKVAADNALRILLESGVRCYDKTFDVHKAVVCARSDWFAKACKPCAFKEGHDGVINLGAATESGDEADPSLDSPEAFKLMIEFLYCHDYEAPAVLVSIEDANIGMPTHKKKLNPSDDCNTVMHAKMYALGSKYMIPSLQAVALGKYTEAASYAWATDEFVTAIGMVYTNTPDEDKACHNITANTIIEHYDFLVQRPEFESQVRSIPELAYDLLGLQSQTVTRLKGHNAVAQCFVCGKDFRPEYCKYHSFYYMNCECQEKTRTLNGANCVCRHSRTG